MEKDNHIFIQCTQAQFDALKDKDDDTLYSIAESNDKPNTKEESKNNEEHNGV